MAGYANETGLVRAIVRAVKDAYPAAYVLNVHGSPYGRLGTPDLIMSVHGYMIAVEAKHQKPGESIGHARSRATFNQLGQIEAINASGGTAAVVLSPQETLDLIAAALAFGTKKEEPNAS